jgi:hypothetical protein
LQGVAEADLAAIHEEAARRGAAAIAALSNATEDLIKQLDYAPVRNFFDFRDGPVVATDPQRFSIATQVAANVRQLSEVLGESVSDILRRMNVPLVDFLRDLGVDAARLDVPSVFDSMVTAARTLGVELDDLAGQLRANIGELSDAASPINDAFERALTKLPTAVGNALRDRLRVLETASSPESRASARQSIIDFINNQPVAIRAALAPFFDEVNVASVQEQQLTAADQSNRYLSAANAFLERIARNTEPTPLRVPPKLPGEKSAQDRTNTLLVEVVGQLRGMQKELRYVKMSSTTGANNG